MQKPMGTVNQLIAWYARNHRDFPWRRTQDPYAIWLSEIILQQTRTEQGLPYYLKFVQTYPSVFHLAKASEREVLQLWEGLGYYSRGRNLLKCAQMVVKQYNGVFPQTITELLKLPGIGPYTASAIGSFAFEIPSPVIDGNVKRFCSRFLGSAEPIDTPAGILPLEQWLTKAITQAPKPSVFNQATMELGATCCTPKQPDCPRCPLAHGCISYAQGTPTALPIKKGKTKVKTWHLNWVLVQTPDGILFQNAFMGAIWKNMHVLPGSIREGDTTIQEHPEWINNLPLTSISEPPLSFKHVLSHRVLHIQVQAFRTEGPIEPPAGFSLLHPSETAKPIPVQKALNHFQIES